MIIVLFVIFLLMIIIGYVLEESYGDLSEIIGEFGIGIGCIAEFIVVICGIGLCFDISKSKVIDRKIKMFQEENKLIEEQVTTVVNSYKDYEKEVISNTG